MVEKRGTDDAPRAPAGFTIIEMLAVITIIMVVMALALPNFVAMMKQRRWSSAVTTMQTMVWRARALATNARKDMSVEFDIQGDNGTTMWLESEMNSLERIPDLNNVRDQMGGGYTFRDWILEQIWTPSGGTYDIVSGVYTNFQIDYANSKPELYGDNARQSEVVELGSGLTIDDSPAGSPHFVNWDSQTSVAMYGWDTHKDIRIGPNGALVQSQDPVICIRQTRGGEYRKVEVIRCTGRLVSAQ
jgi:hypothetical protein